MPIKIRKKSLKSVASSSGANASAFYNSYDADNGDDMNDSSHSKNRYQHFWAGIEHRVAIKKKIETRQGNESNAYTRMKGISLEGGQHHKIEVRGMIKQLIIASPNILKYICP